MASRNTQLLTLLSMSMMLVACTGQVSSLAPMTIQSDDFTQDTSIPPNMTCDGDGARPTLRIANVPAGTKSLVIIVEDPDVSGTFTHWIAWNIDPATTVIRNGDALIGATEGLNSAVFPGYTGPCPPTGTHRYIFRLYALNETLSLSADTLPADVKNELQTRITAEAELTGLYERQELPSANMESDNADAESAEL